MSSMWKGAIVCVVQVTLVAGIGAKLRYDRATRPRLWVKVAPWDPSMPIRGRYLSLQMEVPARGFTIPIQPIKPPYRGYVPYSMQYGKLQVEGNQLVAVRTPEFTGTSVTITLENGQPMAKINESINYYIPENAKDPARVGKGEELWAEVTLPKKGPPRPIRLGIKKNEALTPLNLR